MSNSKKFTDECLNFIKFLYENSQPELYKQFTKLLEIITKNSDLKKEEKYLNFLHEILEKIFMLYPYSTEYALATEYNKEDNQYLSEVNNEIIKFDFQPFESNLIITETTKSSDTTLRDKISNKIKEYLKKYYSESNLHKKLIKLKEEKKKEDNNPNLNVENFLENPNVLKLDDDFGSASYVGLKNDEIYILITQQNYCYASKQTFRWNSYYKLSLNSYEFNGWVKIFNYYFEKGNNSKFNLDEPLNNIKISSKNEDDIANEIYKIIENFENDIQNRLKDLFSNIEQDIMKPLHRGISIIGVDMNWDLDFSDLTSIKK